MRLATFSMIVFVSLLSACNNPEFLEHSVNVHSPAGIDGSLRERLTAFMNEHAVHGLQVSLAKGDQTRHIALGSEDPGRQHLVEMSSMFRIGSVSKTLTAVIIMKLNEEGRIALEAPVSTWFPDLPHSQEMTVRQLLNHTSGVYNYTTNWRLMAKLIVNDHRIWSFSELYDGIRSGSPYFQPGRDHFYSNANYILLGRIAEKQSGESFRSLAERILVSPLGLQSTAFLTGSNDSMEPIIGYDLDLMPVAGWRILPDNTSWPTFAWSAGSFVSTSSDLLAIYRALFGGRLLGNDSLRAMTDFYPCTDEDIAVQTGYGLGLRRFNVNGTIVVGHTGTILGFGAGAFHLPDADAYLTFAANRSSLDQVALIRLILAAIETMAAG